ncbi:MAG: hypothetical protein K2P58_06870 [Hyphomonadaceae bacterium]|nr:hypothetical protein [Hyphomonadaceae bacterium]
MRLFLYAVLAFFTVVPAQAEVSEATPSMFVVQGERLAGDSPDHVWRSVARISQWWDGAHTYSGDARRLSLATRAGGCFCERWADQSVEHARVIMVMEHEGVRTLRMAGALGPLQAIGAGGVLTIVVAPDGDGAKITMNYRVSGDASLGLDAMAPAVDMVLMNQLDRLQRYASTGAARAANDG